MELELIEPFLFLGSHPQAIERFARAIRTMDCFRPYTCHNQQEEAPMRISDYSWVGVRTEDFEATITFLADMLGLPLTWRAADCEIAHFRLSSGQLFEVFGPNDAGIQTTACPVVGFEVADVWVARRELERLGVQFVTEICGTNDDEASWTYFRGPDGQLYELQRPEKAYRMVERE